MKELLIKLLRRRRQLPKRPAFSEYGTTEIASQLRAVFKRSYNVEQLKTVAADEFERYIRSLPGTRDVESEGFTEVAAAMQRDFTIQFEWGHDHDFEKFKISGKMGERHINIIAAFLTDYGLAMTDFAGKHILDIGCWTGGTSLLLAALGAKVHAIEEVRKYADCVDYLLRAFAVPGVTVERLSLFQLDPHVFYDRFDFVFYSGVLYHVTDPVLSLRIVFNCLKNGGRCLLETFGADGLSSYCEYQGAYETYKRDKRGGPRCGWNWFIPSLEATRRMMIDVGFEVPEISLHDGARMLAIGLRRKYADMLRAGLSNLLVR